MSFGWSAGDIVSAVTLVYNLIDALDSNGEVAGQYRNELAFLRSLGRILQPLQIFAEGNTHPTFGQQIGDQVNCIKQPIEEFLTVITNDIIARTRQEMPDIVTTALRETLDRDMLTTLQERRMQISLLEMIKEGQTEDRNLVIRLSNQTEALLLQTTEIRQRIGPSHTAQHQIEPSIQVDHFQDNLAPQETHGILSTRHLRRQLTESSHGPNFHQHDETLEEVYHLVLLHLTQFLKYLFLIISKLVQPSKALMFKLLSKHNITFLDAIGQPPRVLDHNIFRSYEMIHAYILQEFKDHPSFARFASEGYCLSSNKSESLLDKGNWQAIVTPGSIVVMSILTPSFNMDWAWDDCPDEKCSGRWAKSETTRWVKCPKCSKEVLNCSAGLPKNSRGRSGSKNKTELWQQQLSRLYPYHAITASEPRTNLPVSLVFNEDSLPLETFFLQQETDEMPMFTRVARIEHPQARTCLADDLWPEDEEFDTRLGSDDAPIRSGIRTQDLIEYSANIGTRLPSFTIDRVDRWLTHKLHSSVLEVAILAAATDYLPKLAWPKVSSRLQYHDYARCRYLGTPRTPLMDMV